MIDFNYINAKVYNFHKEQGIALDFDELISKTKEVVDLFSIISNQKDYSEKEKETILDNIIHDIYTGSTQRQILTGMSENKHTDYFYTFMGQEAADRLLDIMDKYKIPYSALKGIKASTDQDISGTYTDGNGEVHNINIVQEWERSGGSTPVLITFNVYIDGRQVFDLNNENIDEETLKEQEEEQEEEQQIEKLQEEQQSRELELLEKAKSGLSHNRTYINTGYVSDGLKYKSYYTKTGKKVYGYYNENNQFRWVKKGSSIYEEIVKNDTNVG